MYRRDRVLMMWKSLARAVWERWRHERRHRILLQKRLAVAHRVIEQRHTGVWWAVHERALADASPMTATGEALDSMAALLGVPPRNGGSSSAYRDTSRETDEQLRTRLVQRLAGPYRIDVE